MVISLLCLLDLPASVSAAGGLASPSNPLDVLTSAAVLGVAAASAGTAIATMCRNVSKTSVRIAEAETPSNINPSNEEATESDSDIPIGTQARVRRQGKPARTANCPTTPKTSKPKKGKQASWDLSLIS